MSYSLESVSSYMPDVHAFDRHFFFLHFSTSPSFFHCALQGVSTESAFLFRETIPAFMLIPLGKCAILLIVVSGNVWAFANWNRFKLCKDTSREIWLNTFLYCAYWLWCAKRHVAITEFWSVIKPNLNLSDLLSVCLIVFVYFLRDLHIHQLLLTCVCFNLLGFLSCSSFTVIRRLSFFLLWSSILLLTNAVTSVIRAVANRQECVI